MKKRILILCLCFMLLLSGCSNIHIFEKSDEYSISFFAMDTYMTFTAFGKNAELALTKARDRITTLEGLWSITDKNSDTYIINHAEGETVEVKDETAELLRYSLNMAEQTKGALDITIYPILSAWGFTTGKNRIPKKDEIIDRLKLVGYKNVVQKGNLVQLPLGGMIDFGAVAKGYSGDIIEDILRENQITSAFLNLGGNIHTVGSKPDGTDWRIGVQDPKSDGIVGVLQVSDLAVVTSGAYERYFIGEDGKQYGHIIDPSSGYPVENGLLSVTIIAKEGRLCDALSTSLFVMGKDMAIEYWLQNQNFDMILITENDDIYITDGIYKNFKIDSMHSNMKVHTIGK